VHSVGQAQQMSDERMGDKSPVSCTSYSVIFKAFEALFTSIMLARSLGKDTAEESLFSQFRT
jgi:hypothetical protein